LKVETPTTSPEHLLLNHVKIEFTQKLKVLTSSRGSVASADRVNIITTRKIIEN